MTRYAITSQSGVDLGTYDGPAPADALDNLARDAGCPSRASACRALGVALHDWTTDASAFRRGTIALLVTEVTA